MDRVLFVDDEINVLEAVQRNLCEYVDVDIAQSGEEALKLMDDHRYAVLVSDMRMPAMDGAALLSQARQRWPDTVRILLTGHADVESAISAVNEGRVFRYLSKPCPNELLLQSIRDAVEQFKTRAIERELLEGTLDGTMSLLVEVLALAAPDVFGRAKRLQRCVEHMARACDAPQVWQYGIAALMSQLGCVALPGDLVARVLIGQATPKERDLFARHPETAARLLSSIPRMETVAKIVSLQNARELPATEDLTVRLGVDLLQVALAVDALVVRGERLTNAIDHLRRIRPDLRKDLLDHLSTFDDAGLGSTTLYVMLRDLRIGMVLAADVESKSGTLILAQGHSLTLLHLERLRRFAEGAGIVEPLKVMGGQ